MPPFLREGRRYVVKRFHSFLGETLSQGQQLALEAVVGRHDDRSVATEFRFRDLASGRVIRWTIDAALTEDTGRDLFDEDPGGAPAG
ncbi:MAG TPA: hypothetical protein VLI67_06985 [Vicinamibacteria bacterium]|nr:hypothetical protein [Vicinamibacteria bacterium]